MSATASDKEAVCYEGEIASVLESSGFEVEIDNSKRKTPGQSLPAGLEMTIKETTVRPIHAYRIVTAFRRAGIAIATKINGRRRKNNTLYIAVGPNAAPSIVPAVRTPATWRSEVRASLLEKWKRRFS